MGSEMCIRDRCWVCLVGRRISYTGDGASGTAENYGSVTTHLITLNYNDDDTLYDAVISSPGVTYKTYTDLNALLDAVNALE